MKTAFYISAIVTALLWLWAYFSYQASNSGPSDDFGAGVVVLLITVFAIAGTITALTLAITMLTRHIPFI